MTINAELAIRPNIDEVAKLILDRTTDASGALARTFNDTTEPTADEVDGLIDLVLDAIDPRVPSTAGNEVKRAARHIVALKTAILVENTFLADQGEVTTPRIENFQTLITEHNVTLDTAANENEPGKSRIYSLDIKNGVATTDLGLELLP